MISEERPELKSVVKNGQAAGWKVRRAQALLAPWRKRMWCIPPTEDAAFVCPMEQVLEEHLYPKTVV